MLRLIAQKKGFDELITTQNTRFVLMDRFERQKKIFTVRPKQIPNLFLYAQPYMQFNLVDYGVLYWVWLYDYQGYIG